MQSLEQEFRPAPEHTSTPHSTYLFARTRTYLTLFEGKFNAAPVPAEEWQSSPTEGTIRDLSILNPDSPLRQTGNSRDRGDDEDSSDDEEDSDDEGSVTLRGSDEDWEIESDDEEDITAYYYDKSDYGDEEVETQTATPMRKPSKKKKRAVIFEDDDEDRNGYFDDEVGKKGRGGKRIIADDEDNDGEEESASYYYDREDAEEEDAEENEGRRKRKKGKNRQTLKGKRAKHAGKNKQDQGVDEEHIISGFDVARVDNGDGGGLDPPPNRQLKVVQLIPPVAVLEDNEEENVQATTARQETPARQDEYSARGMSQLALKHYETLKAYVVANVAEPSRIGDQPETVRISLNHGW